MGCARDSILGHYIWPLSSDLEQLPKPGKLNLIITKILNRTPDRHRNEAMLFQIGDRVVTFDK